jgi:hypothetical protein
MQFDPYAVLAQLTRFLIDLKRSELKHNGQFSRPVKLFASNQLGIDEQMMFG